MNGRSARGAIKYDCARRGGAGNTRFWITRETGHPELRSASFQVRKVGPMTTPPLAAPRRLGQANAPTGGERLVALSTASLPHLVPTRVFPNPCTLHLGLIERAFLNAGWRSVRTTLRSHDLRGCVCALHPPPRDPRSFQMTVSAATGCSFLLSTAVNAEAHAHPAWGVRQDMGAAAWSEDESIAWTHRLYVGRRHHRTRGSGGKNRKACLHGRQRVIGGEIWGKVLLRT